MVRVRINTIRRLIEQSKTLQVMSALYTRPFCEQKKKDIIRWVVLHIGFNNLMVLCSATKYKNVFKI